MASTLNGTGITFSDGSTTSSNSTLGAIGSVMLAIYTANGALSANTTVSGSLLTYQWTGQYSINSASQGFSPNNVCFGGAATRFNNSTYNSGGTTLSGTWRQLSSGSGYGSGATGCGPVMYWPVHMWVRVS
jgi:hypothetical protein